MLWSSLYAFPNCCHPLWVPNISCLGTFLGNKYTHTHFFFPLHKVCLDQNCVQGVRAQIPKWLALGYDEKNNIKGSVGSLPMHLVPQAIGSQLGIPSSPPKTVTDDQRRRFRQSKQTLTLEAGTLHLQGPKILQRGAEDRRIRNKEVSREPHLAWCLANWLYCVSGQADHLQGHEGYLSFGLLTWHLGRSGSILSLQTYFKKTTMAC